MVRLQRATAVANLRHTACIVHLANVLLFFLSGISSLVGQGYY